MGHTLCCFQDDEEAAEAFAVYCGLALHHAKLYDKIHRSEQKHKVALEVLSYHNSSSTSELEEILAEGPPPEEDRDDIARYFNLTSEQVGIKY